MIGQIIKYKGIEYIEVEGKCKDCAFNRKNMPNDDRKACKKAHCLASLNIYVKNK